MIYILYLYQYRADLCLTSKQIFRRFIYVVWMMYNKHCI